MKYKIILHVFHPLFKIKIKNSILFNYFSGNQRIDMPAAYLIYLPTHIRGMPFLLGIILGYFIYKEEKSKNSKREKSTVILSLNYFYGSI